MALHRWMGLGSAAMTDEQAAEWAGAEGSSVDQPLALEMSRVLCVVCGQAYIGADPTCSGPPEPVPSGHQWASLMTVQLTDQEAMHWADPEDEFELDIRPRSTNVVCVLCGAPYEGSSEVCSEWRFWQLDDGTAADWVEG